MKLTEALQELRQTISSLYDVPEANAISIWAMEAITGKNRAIQLRDAEEELNADEVQLWQQYTRELGTGKPVQYVTGISYFYGLKLRVNPSVLIPRPETEELVALALKQRETFDSASIKVLDIGTGSGCIALAYKHQRPKDTVWAIEVSEPPLKLAQKNEANNCLNVQFLLADILQLPKVGEGEKCELILSNQSDITLDEKGELSKQVIDFEPAKALFVTNQDPLQFYKAIEMFSSRHLKPNGKL